MDAGTGFGIALGVGAALAVLWWIFDSAPARVASRPVRPPHSHLGRKASRPRLATSLVRGVGRLRDAGRSTARLVRRSLGLPTASLPFLLANVPRRA